MTSVIDLPYSKPIPHETIIPLLNICRKLEGCDSSQLLKFVGKLLTIFKQNNSSHILIKILLSGICKNHSQISSFLFDQIESILPNENELDLDDT
eukprot:152423_1